MSICLERFCMFVTIDEMLKLVCRRKVLAPVWA